MKTEQLPRQHPHPAPGILFQAYQTRQSPTWLEPSMVGCKARKVCASRIHFRTRHKTGTCIIHHLFMVQFQHFIHAS